MSPSATLTDVDARNAALGAADKLFYSRGIGPVTMADVRDESGVSFRRLYAMFSSKEELVTAWLEHRHEAWMSGFASRVDANTSTGMSEVDALFAALHDWMVATEFRGCGFINTHAESSALTDAHIEIIRAHKIALRDYLALKVPHADAVAVLVDGAIVQSSIFATTDPIRRANEAARTITQNREA